ncbi:heavy-metal-associated domain-containing protein [Flavobacterium sp. GNP002]
MQLLILKNKNISILTDNIIPGNHGQIFGTNAMKEADLIEIKSSLLELDGIKEVLLNTEIFPREFTIHTSKMIPISNIENRVKLIGFHAIPKGVFKL